MRWPVVRYDGAHDRIPKPRMWTPETLIERLCRPVVWHRRKLDAPCWAPSVMVGPDATRAAANVSAVSMLVLDCDAGDPLRDLEALGDGYVRVGHTSWSHTPLHPKARLVFPFQRPCPVRHWGRVWGAAARWAAEHGVSVDPAAKDASRLYFGPYVPPTGPAGVQGVPVDWFRAWAYGPDDPPNPGMLPPRPRELLNWARLASAYPEPEPEPFVVPVVQSRPPPSADVMERKRRAFARGMIARRCSLIVTHGKGGRNVRVFAAGRLAGSLAAGGWVHLSDAVAEIEQAALAAGLDLKETRRALRNGLAAGASDGVYDIDQHLQEAR